MENILSTLGVPGTVAFAILLGYTILNVLGELISLKGKIVPEWMALRKYFKRKKLEEIERLQTLKDVQKLLADVNKHYSEDNIACRNQWMKTVDENIIWTQERADYYDKSIDRITITLADASTELMKLRRQSEEDHAQRIRNKIIEFATKVVREDYRATKDEFNYIFKIHEEYDQYIHLHNIKNDQINDCIEIIREEHKEYIKHNRFLEAKRNLSD